MPITLRSMRTVGGRHTTQVPFRHTDTGTVVKVDMSSRPKEEWEEAIKEARMNKTMIASEYIVEH